MVYNNILLALTEAVYVIYILNFFKTKYSLAHPLTYFENQLLYHPIGKSNKPICNICRLGNIGAYFIAGFIIIRFIILNKNGSNSIKNSIKTMSIFVLLLVITLSFLNFNAVVYLMPYFVFEIVYIKNL